MGMAEVCLAEGREQVGWRVEVVEVRVEVEVEVVGVLLSGPVVSVKSRAVSGRRRLGKTGPGRAWRWAVLCGWRALRE